MFVGFKFSCEEWRVEKVVNWVWMMECWECMMVGEEVYLFLCDWGLVCCYVCDVVDFWCNLFGLFMFLVLILLFVMFVVL